jgi:hypothetical protein
LWHLFQNVVLLDEQMRQQNDPAYHSLLKRTRDCTLAQTDVDLLNTRVITNLESRPDRLNTRVVRSNKLRHLINRQQIDAFARSRQQKVFIFPARHTRWRRAKGDAMCLLTKSWRYQIAPRSKALACSFTLRICLRQFPKYFHAAGYCQWSTWSSCRNSAEP